jgi:hypothetical protein
MVDALKAQEQDPASRELSFLERLGLLVDQQWTWRENQALARRLHAVKLKGACVEEIDYRASRGLDKSVIRTLTQKSVVGYFQSSPLWRDGFPSYPLAAVRNLSEGRRLLDSAKPTGGWPYWHYLDEITGEWESLAHLWERACGMGGTEPGRGKLARTSKATIVVSAERDLRDRP